MNRIIYTIFKTLAVLFVLFIFLSISALAQSFTLHNIALLVVSVICLNKRRCVSFSSNGTMK